jgi:hypothetical protein
MAPSSSPSLLSSVALALSSLLLAPACGGGGGGGGGGGVFVDSFVAGMDYVSGNTKSVTTAQGRFGGAPGTTVLFALGDVVVGLAPFSRQLTPISLVPGATDETDPTVTNIARLLQSLDMDGDADNGIVIPEAVRMAGIGLSLNFDQSLVAFENDPAVATLLAAAGGPPLVPAGEAQAHLRASIQGSYTGRYTGAYAGDDTGPFDVFVDRSGRLVGCAFSNEDQEVLAVTGDVGLDGISVFGNTNTQSTFSGTVEGGVISGTWANAMYGTSGTFTGSRVEAPAFTLKASELAPFLGTYACTFVVPGETGPFTTVIGAGGDADITDPNEPSEVSATITGIANGVATLVGVSEDGTVLRGTVMDDGTMSGTLFDVHEGIGGTFTGTR